MTIAEFKRIKKYIRVKEVCDFCGMNYQTFRSYLYERKGREDTAVLPGAFIVGLYELGYMLADMTKIRPIPEEEYVEPVKRRQRKHYRMLGYNTVFMYKGELHKKKSASVAMRLRDNVNVKIPFDIGEVDLI